MIYTKQKKFKIDNGFKVSKKGLESVLEYKKHKRKNIYTFIACLLLGGFVYLCAHTCSHQKEKPRGELYENGIGNNQTNFGNYR